MPDLFIAPDDKPIRSRIRLPIQQNLQQSTNANQTQPVQNQQQDPPAQPAEISPEPQNMQDMPNNPDSTQNKNEQPAYDDIERRNGILPLFSSFWQNPRSIYFDTQEPDEHILLFLRRHFITNFSWISLTILLLVIPPLTVYLLNSFKYPLVSLPQPLTQVIIILYYLLVLTNAFVNFLDWYYNITIITTQRVLDIHLKDLVNKQESATKITLIQDVDFKQTGTIPSIFNYGDVIIQTAGKEINFIADAVPNPEFVVEVVENLIGKEVTVELQGGQNAAV